MVLSLGPSYSFEHDYAPIFTKSHLVCLKWSQLISGLILRYKWYADCEDVWSLVDIFLDICKEAELSFYRFLQDCSQFVLQSIHRILMTSNDECYDG